MPLESRTLDDIKTEPRLDTPRTLSDRIAFAALVCLAIVTGSCSSGDQARADAPNGSRPEYVHFAQATEGETISPRVMNAVLSSLSRKIVNLEYPNPGRHALHIKMDLIEDHAIKYPQPFGESSTLIRETSDEMLPFIIVYGYDGDTLRIDITSMNGGSRTAVKREPLGSSTSHIGGGAFPLGYQSLVYLFAETAEPFRVSGTYGLEEYVSEFERVIAIYVTIEPLADDEFLDA